MRGSKGVRPVARRSFLAVLLLAAAAALAEPGAAESRQLAVTTPQDETPPKMGEPRNGCPAAGACTWARTYGGARADKLRAATGLPGGDVVLVGKTRSHAGLRASGWAIRLNRAGERVWTRTLRGAAALDALTAVVPARDGGVIAVGHTRTQGEGKSDGWVLKLDRLGDVVWERTFGGATYDRLLGATATPDGGVVATGFTASRGAGDRDVWALRLDSSGDRVWQKTFGTPADEGGFAATARAGAVTIAGYARTDDGSYDVWAGRLALADGTAVWTRRYDRSRLDGAMSAAALPGGDVVLGAITAGNGFGQDDIWVLRLRPDGARRWAVTLGGSKPDSPWSVAAAPGGGALVTASTQSRGAGSADAWLLHLDAAGQVSWQRTFGGALWDWPGVILPVDGDSLLLGGYTTSSGAGYEDGWVLRLDARGRL